VTADLEIDTVALRIAAGRIAEAAAACRTHHLGELPAMPAAALGGTALARETALLVHRRVAQAFELADGIAEVADGLAARVRAVADLFDRAEVARPAGG
jgi:hypothetical protein